MRRLQVGAVSALALMLGINATQADAQSLRGFRAEGQVGVSSFHSEGNSKSKIGWGGAVGVDAYIANNFVLGAEGTFWWAPAENHTHDGAGIADHKTFEEWGMAARAGYMVTPTTLVYGKAGWVRNEQRKRFTPDVGVCGGNACQAAGYYIHNHTSGFVWGGGVEQGITSGFYVKAEGRYSDYKNHTHTLTGLLGVGILVGATEAAPPPPPSPPPPPPPPPPPATQTCPDGSVIPATDTCPAPPPPPPPPPAQRGERG